MKKAHNPKTTCLDARQELAIARLYKRILFASIDRISRHFLSCRSVKFQCENDRNSSTAKGNHELPVDNDFEVHIATSFPGSTPQE